MKNFYTIKNDVEQAGFIPQDTGFIGDYPIFAPDSLNSLAWSFPNDNMRLPEGVKLHYRSKWTDYMRFSCISVPYLIISNTLWGIISKHSICPSLEIYDLKLVRQKEERIYVLLVIRPGCWDCIDYSKTDVNIGNYKTNIYKRVRVASYEQWMELDKTMEDPNYTTLINPVLRTEDIEYDFFRLGFRGGFSNYIISEKLKMAIESATLKGVLTEPYPYV